MSTWQRYAGFGRAPYEYLDAGKGYAPGYVNCVKVYAEFESYLVYVTDGYKEQFLGNYKTSDEARAAGVDALVNGTEGGSIHAWEGHGHE